MMLRASFARIVVSSSALMVLGACGSNDTTAPDPCTARVTQTIGATQSGSFATTDCRLGGLLTDRYSFTVPAGGATVRITPASSAINARLKLYDAQSRLIAVNVAGAATNAPIRIMLAPGTYFLDASSAATDGTGDYTLALTSIDAAVSGCHDEFLGERAYLTIGFTTTQQIETTDCSVSPPGAGGTYYSDRFLLHLNAGQSATIRMSSTSATLDPFLSLYRFNGVQPLLLDDDDNGGGGTTAQVSYAATDTITLLIDAGTEPTGQTGPYTLSVQTATASALSAASDRLLAPARITTRP